MHSAFFRGFFLLACALGLAGAGPKSEPGVWSVLVVRAGERFGDEGREAAEFLAAHAPARDASLDEALLMENLELALRARREFPWSERLTDELFLNDVLPYAVLDETRERWRAELFPIASEIVKDAGTFEAAAQALNRELFNRIGVHYNTGRKAPNQSPAESIAQGRATCTGLSILLVDACRSVGVPARIAGVPAWTTKPGNHTWVEVWDGNAWRFTGADEYDAAGLDRGWFVGDAAKADASDPAHAVWASSWRRTGEHFPLAWDEGSRDVPGVNVTDRYAPPAQPEKALAGDATHIRLWDAPPPGGTRIESAVRVFVGADEDRPVAEGHTRAGRADLNDTFSVPLKRGVPVRIELTANDQTRVAWPDLKKLGAERVIDLVWDDLSLDEQTAERLVGESWERTTARLAKELGPELDAEAFTVGDKTMRILQKRFGAAPEGERSLWISMHGGGGAPAEVNDQQWRNQIRLYEPPEGFYLAPRAPTDTWNLWHQDHIDALFDRVIGAYVALRGVDPDRVYLMGYSAGGDGAYQLAPRMADRFAAASMMAGHPNDASPLGLRNLPFAIFAGAEDAAYDRNKVAKQWGDRLDELHAADRKGYEHLVRIYPGKGHWMDRLDAESVPWMAAKKRDAWPQKVVWRQDDVTHTRFYWLGVSEDDAVAGRDVTASVTGQTIKLDAPDLHAITLRLRDELIDLDKPIRVVVNGKRVYEGRVPRSPEAIDGSLSERPDPRTCATATLDLTWE